MCNVTVRESEDYLHVETDDLASLRDAVGEPLLSAFCRCFVHADRLTSLIHFIKLLDAHCSPDSVAATRDLYSMAWFAIGTLREYMKAVQLLRAEMKKARCFDKNSPHWQELLRVERRWEHDRDYVNLRDHAAFHVDPKHKIVPRGLDRIAKQGTATLVIMDKPDRPTAQVGHWYRIGMEALMDGYHLELSREYFARIFEQVATDIAVSDHLFEIFRQALRDKGISFDVKEANGEAGQKGEKS